MGRKAGWCTEHQRTMHSNILLGGKETAWTRLQGGAGSAGTPRASGHSVHCRLLWDAVPKGAPHRVTPSHSVLKSTAGPGLSRKVRVQPVQAGTQDMCSRYAANSPSRGRDSDAWEVQDLNTKTHGMLFNRTSNGHHQVFNSDSLFHCASATNN